MSSASQVSEAISSQKSGDSDLQEFLSFIQEMLVQTTSTSEFESCTAVPKLTSLLLLPSTGPGVLGKPCPERLSQPTASPRTQASEGKADPVNRSTDNQLERLPIVHITRQAQGYRLPCLSDLQSL